MVPRQMQICRNGWIHLTGVFTATEVARINELVDSLALPSPTTGLVKPFFPGIGV